MRDTSAGMCSDGVGKASTLITPLRTFAVWVSRAVGGEDDSRTVDQVDLTGKRDALPDLGKRG